jgi:methylmalonyl-CoA/ethylmalonyl-CoA epimerase
MGKSKVAKSPFSYRLLHVGVAVKDMDKAVKRLESLGIGPFEPLGLKKPFVKGHFHGRPYKPNTKTLAANMGNIQLELIQPISGESPYQEFLESKGEGIQHLTFAVNDLDKEEAKFTAQGVEVTMSGRFQDVGGGDYLDLGVGGITVCLFQE